MESRVQNLTEQEFLNVDDFSFDNDIVLEIFAEQALETVTGKTSAL